MKVAGIAALGVSVGGCSSSKSKKKNAAQRSQKVSRKDFADRKNYDVVVIGTGMGGAAAGAIIAHHGLKTLILEKNPTPGGSCSFYRKQGFHMDTGAHNFIRGNKGPFGTVTQRLGMGTPIDFRRAGNTLQVKGINMNVTVPENLIFRGMAMPNMIWQLKINPVHYVSVLNVFHKIMLMSEREVERLDNVDIDTFLKQYCKDDKTRNIVAGALGVMIILPPWKASAGESIWNIQKLLKGMYVSYPKGGAVSIPRTFLEGAENNGAEIRMNAGVRRIIVKDGQVDHVILDNGQSVKTRMVISTTSAKDSILRLVGEEHVPEAYAKQIKAILPAFTAVQAKLALKKEVVKSGLLFGAFPNNAPKNVLGEYVHKTIRNLYNGKQGEYIPLYAPIPTSFDPDLAPPGCQIITAVAPAPTLDVQLKDTEQSWIDGLMKALHDIIPDLKENIIFCDTWSVRATAEWVGKSDGSAISTGQVVGQTGKNRLPHQTPIKGLYLAGDCAGPARGVGTELACQSGIDCADLAAEDFRASRV